jgi:hypothetical protein
MPEVPLSRVRLSHEIQGESIGMRKLYLLGGIVCLLIPSMWAQAPRRFDWVRASDETSVLDPADFHAGRVYHPGDAGGNLHVDIDASLPVTIAMTSESAWLEAKQNPESARNLTFSCMREHVVATTYECSLPSSTPMVLLVRDEQVSSHIVSTRWGAIMTASRSLVTPNNLHITYYRWDCVANCLQPEYRWVRLVKEKYELTSVPKMYTFLGADHNGQKVSLKIKAPVPMTVALLPTKVADRVYDDPSILRTAMQESSCKQRGVQELAFSCTLDVADGRQALVVVPEASIPSHKKTFVELQTLQCTANCELIPN